MSYLPPQTREEFEERVTENLLKYPGLPEACIRLVLSNNPGCPISPGIDQGRGTPPLCGDPDFEVRETGYKILDALAEDEPEE